MQTLPSAIRLKVRARLPGGAIVLTTEQDPEKPNADLVPQAYEAAAWFAERMPGVAQLRSQKPSCRSRRPCTSSAALSSARRPRLVSSTSTDHACVVLYTRWAASAATAMTVLAGRIMTMKSVILPSWSNSIRSTPTTRSSPTRALNSRT
jgi:hypothetical protein